MGQPGGAFETDFVNRRASMEALVWFLIGNGLWVSGLVVGVPIVQDWKLLGECEGKVRLGLALVLIVLGVVVVRVVLSGRVGKW